MFCLPLENLGLWCIWNVLSANVDRAYIETVVLSFIKCDRRKKRKEKKDKGFYDVLSSSCGAVGIV